MSEPTEPPSPRRLRQARARGQVASSPTLSGAAALLGGLAALAVTVVAGAGALRDYTAAALTAAARGESAATATAALRAGAAMALRLALPVLVAAALAALVVGFVQVGPLWARARSQGGVALGGAAQGVLRGAAVLLVLVLVLRSRAGELVWLGREAPGRQAALLGALALGLLSRVAMVLAAFGLVELMLARRTLLRRLGMTRRDLLREQRETEGDPALRRERERLGEEALAEASEATAVAGALCVIAGERLAVALAWPDPGAAPVIVARGRAFLARRLLGEARRRGVAIYGDDALARALWAPVGAHIAPGLYDPVATLVRRALAG